MCILASTCDVLVEGANQNILFLSGDDPNNVQYGNVAEFNCSEGYTLSGGHSIIYCTKEGKWSSEIAPTCNRRCYRRKKLV